MRWRMESMQIVTTPKSTMSSQIAMSFKEKNSENSIKMIYYKTHFMHLCVFLQLIDLYNM